MRKVMTALLAYTGKIRVQAVQFPHIIRFFPEAFARKHLLLNQVFLISFACGFTLMGIAILGLQLQENMQLLKQTEQAQRARYVQMQYWEQIVAKYPDYRDGYYKLAALALSLGEPKKAEELIKKAIHIDPRFLGGYRLQKEIQILL